MSKCISIATRPAAVALLQASYKKKQYRPKPLGADANDEPFRQDPAQAHCRDREDREIAKSPKTAKTAMTGNAGNAEKAEIGGRRNATDRQRGGWRDVAVA